MAAAMVTDGKIDDGSAAVGHDTLVSWGLGDGRGRPGGHGDGAAGLGGVDQRRGGGCNKQRGGVKGLGEEEKRRGKENPILQNLFLLFSPH